MSDNPLDRIPSFDRVSIRAVVVYDGADQGQALSEAGIVDPIALPMVFGEGQPDNSFGDGFTPNLTAVLEPDQEDDAPFDAPSQDDGPRAQDNGSRRREGTGQAQSATVTCANSRQWLGRSGRDRGESRTSGAQSDIFSRGGGTEGLRYLL